MTGRLRRHNSWFVAAGALAVLAALVTMRAASAERPRASVLVAAVDLQVGTRVREPFVVLVQVPSGGVLPGMFRNVDDARGRVVTAPVAAGQVVTEGALGGADGVGPAPLVPGERAMSVPRSAAGAAAAILVPGSRVDIVATRGDSVLEAQVVVRGAEVLAIADAAGLDDPAVAGGGAVLLRLSSGDALRLTVALDLGRGVRLLPRPITESTG